ncbi:MAG TPA: hypothetical protein VLT82_19505 [Myxococcaceae bacterium]|nr:hypothetical protein [Myxococcaceae bacterium]
MMRWSCFARGARRRAGIVSTAVAAAVLVTGSSAGAGPRSRRIVDGEQARQIMLRHGGEAFKPEVATSRTSDGLSPRSGGDGTVSLNLEGRFQHVHYAIPDGTGGFTVGCTDDLATLRQATGEGK